jgi:hypothetical protein
MPYLSNAPTILKLLPGYGLFPRHFYEKTKNAKQFLYKFKVNKYFSLISVNKLQKFNPR